MTIKLKEYLENEFVENLSKVLHETFHNTPLKFKVSYFLGENEANERYLCFLIDSKQVGIIYDKNKIMLPHELVSDHEEEFINNTIKDLVLGGVSFLQGERMKAIIENSGIKTKMFVMNLN